MFVQIFSNSSHGFMQATQRISKNAPCFADQIEMHWQRRKINLFLLQLVTHFHKESNVFCLVLKTLEARPATVATNSVTSYLTYGSYGLEDEIYRIMISPLRSRHTHGFIHRSGKIVELVYAHVILPCHGLIKRTQ